MLETVITVDDDAILRRSITAYLEDQGHRVLEAEDGRSGLETIRRENPDLVLLDLRMPVMDGLEVLRVLQEEAPEMPVIVISGMGVIGDVVESLRRGAWDYLIKPIEDLAVLGHVTEMALERARLRRENHKYREDLETKVRERTAELHVAHQELRELHRRLELENEYLRAEVFPVDGSDFIVGESTKLREVMRQIGLVAPTEANVLISGESGTGKELVAWSIHEKSERRERPLIKVNCASIPRELFESEFFGHARGAFTGAVRDRIGRFQLAHLGTIFLDEIGEIPVELQGKLLRVLQDGEFERVGEDVTRKVDVRVIAATNRDLAREINSDRFREDLFFRLSVFPIEIPPLRDRLGDIPPLTIHFLELAKRRLGVPEVELKQGHIEQLLRYSWPGNVRELQNVIERAVINARGGNFRFDLPAVTVGPDPQRKIARQPAAADSAPDVLNESEMKAQERRNILRALERANWKISGTRSAAEMLGIKPTTLVSRMKAMEIKKPQG